MIKAAKSKKYGVIYNVAGGKEISINKISNMRKMFIFKRPGEPDKSLGDIKKIKKD